MLNRLSQIVDKTKLKVKEKLHAEDSNCAETPTDNTRPPPTPSPRSPFTPLGEPDASSSSPISPTAASSSRPISAFFHRSSSKKMSPPPGLTTVPCQYRTGKTLGSGTYAIVKEAVHITTGEYYACKVINKKLMEGREYMVRNEIAVLKKISKNHRNIVTLHDYFETQHNLYLCFDLCTGGELFDRICKKGNYYEQDAAELVRTVLKAVEYLHTCGVVHRDLKPENLLFRTPAEEADIMIADFGLSRIMDDDQLTKLTEVCGTPGYMAPEIFKKTGHGKPVDIWAMGVISYFLLCGYTPFDRDTSALEMQAILAGDYKFDDEYWSGVSDTAKNFVSTCLTLDAEKRPTAKEALEHPWLASAKGHYVPDPASPTGGPTDLLPTIQKAFNARKALRKAIFSVVAAQRMTSLAHGLTTEQGTRLRHDVRKYKEESEKEHVDSEDHVHALDEENAKSPVIPTPSDSQKAASAGVVTPTGTMKSASPKAAGGEKAEASAAAK